MQALSMISDKEYLDLAQNGARILFDYYDYRLLDGYKDESRSYFLKDFKTEQTYLLDMETCYSLVTLFYCRGNKQWMQDCLNDIISSEAKRLSIETWKNIFRNMEEDDDEVEVLWLDGSNQWCLCFDCEMFEDGFKSEEEAQDRLNHIEGVIADEAKNM